MTFRSGVRKRWLIAKETSIANCEVLEEKHRMIAVQGIFVGIIIKASGATLEQTFCLPSLFVKSKPGKLVSSLVGCLLFVNFDTK